jgi:hypothetical protein
LSITLFEQTPLNEVFAESKQHNSGDDADKQLILFEY